MSATKLESVCRRIGWSLRAAVVLAAAACQPSHSPGDVDWSRLLAADGQPENWLTSGRDFGKSHFSPLAQINHDNVSRLNVAWEFDTGTTRGLEATPIVIDGVMYASGVAGRVYALDAATGKARWTFEPQVDMRVTRSACCDSVNRGIAVLGGKVYVAALDGELYALDARTGGVLWQQDTLVDHQHAYTSTGAPEVAGGVVVIGNAGGEYDARGYISAYDLGDGRLKWRFFTVPGAPGKPYEHPELALAAKTWDTASRWETGGGGATWDGMVYDPQLDLLYVGTGNANIYPRRVRSPGGGDNLFTCSILAIHPETGRMAWYYQEVPADQWDYDSVQPMILTRLKFAGIDRDVLLHAPKDGFLYVLDRRTGELLAANPFVKVNWAKYVDLHTGRPVENPDAADYADGAKLVSPATVGAHTWPPMAWSPLTGLLYVPTTEGGNIIERNVTEAYQRGSVNVGVNVQFTAYLPKGGAGLSPEKQRLVAEPNADLTMRSYLRALDPLTGKVAWQVPSEGGWWDRAGVLATGGALVFQGTATGHMRAYDARSGRLLRDLDVSSSIMAAPMTYSVGGVQYVAVMAGWGGGGWSLPHPESAAARYGNEGRILAFRLDGHAPPQREPLAPPGPIPAPPAQTAAPAVVSSGAQLFQRNCSHCHVNMTGSAAPDLRRMTPATHALFDKIVLGGLLQPAGMPRWDDVLSEADAQAIHAYLIAAQNAAYQDQQHATSGNPETNAGGRIY